VGGQRAQGGVQEAKTYQKISRLSHPDRNLPTGHPCEAAGDVEQKGEWYGRTKRKKKLSKGRVRLKKFVDKGL